MRSLCTRFGFFLCQKLCNVVSQLTRSVSSWANCLLFPAWSPESAGNQSHMAWLISDGVQWTDWNYKTTACEEPTRNQGQGGQHWEDQTGGSLCSCLWRRGIDPNFSFSRSTRKTNRWPWHLGRDWFVGAGGGSGFSQCNGKNQPAGERWCACRFCLTSFCHSHLLVGCSVV